MTVTGPSARTAASYDCFAVTAPGLEMLAARELRALGARRVKVEPGGVAFGADAARLLSANLRLRTVSRVIVRLAEFPARAFHELERRARQVPWERVVAPGHAVRMRVTCRKSRLYHSDAVAERLLAAVERRVPGIVAGGRETPPDDTALGDAADDDSHEGEGEGEQLIVVRVFRDRVLVSADSSGALLHRRGYRQAVAKAPLRETLAAAVLMGAGWDPTSPLVDPMCGSGTIAIEGALLARRIAPGLGRAFAMEGWPEVDRAVVATERDRAREEMLPAAPAPIVAADRDEGAVAAARANAERAGVAADVTVVHRPLSATEPPTGTHERGWLVTNPPYGARIGERDRLRDLYARLGQVARTRFPGWTVALLSADAALEAQVGLELRERLETRNGGLPVRLVAGRS